MTKLVYIFMPNEFVIGQVLLKSFIKMLAVATLNKTVVIQSAVQVVSFCDLHYACINKKLYKDHLVSKSNIRICKSRMSLRDVTSAILLCTLIQATRVNTCRTFICLMHGEIYKLINYIRIIASTI
jgi:hypothetical protein